MRATKAALTALINRVSKVRQELEVTYLGPSRICHTLR
jgi:hypothetical protein